jgi:hypothetical protein
VIVEVLGVSVVVPRVKLRGTEVGVATRGCAAVVTVNVVAPTTGPKVALIMLVPAPTPVAKPAAEIVAAAVVPDAHVTEDVRTWVVVSVYVPVATNCCVADWAMAGLAGVTAIDCSAAAVTVNTSAGEVTPFSEAVMLLVPIATPVAKPPLVIVAFAGVADAHVTDDVRTWVVVSL